ncbi:hypothetical protein LG047_04440 [Methylocystis sp. WRRC1]|uniref:hypothetical protein n=1 Tax=Methylocystis sp. WRRC1 TaxID=1732014 RepID=UPI001D138C4E|nr:hypothetical protein [Methylocystis sp. WRRC1]MCC3244577.1 hypothetical protein [Methylocystis sp. WRRC1]
MGYILSILLSIFPLLAWNKIRELLTPTGFETAMREGGTGLRGDMMRFLALRLDAMQITETQFVVTSLVMGLLLIFIGFLCDVLLHDRGFGPKGNSGVLLFGAAIFSTAWVALAPKEYITIFSGTVLISAVGGAVTLVAAALLKRALAAAFDGFSSKGPSRPEGVSMRHARGNPMTVLRRRVGSSGH